MNSLPKPVDVVSLCSEPIANPSKCEAGLKLLAAVAYLLHAVVSVGALG